MHTNKKQKSDIERKFDFELKKKTFFFILVWLFDHKYISFRKVNIYIHFYRFFLVHCKLIVFALFDFFFSIVCELLHTIFLVYLIFHMAFMRLFFRSFGSFFSSSLFLHCTNVLVLVLFLTLQQKQRKTNLILYYLKNLTKKYHFHSITHWNMAFIKEK